MKINNKIIQLAVCSALASTALPAIAGGFGIATQSGSGTGNAFAGGAAAADDASVAWSNPAAMTVLPMGTQVTFALHSVRPSFKYRDAGSTGPGTFNRAGAFDSTDGGDWNFIPNGFFVTSITPSLRLGFALNAPFGLKTGYDYGWRGGLTAQDSSIQTINLNPSLAFKVNDVFSIGIGVSAQRIQAELSSLGNANPAAGIVTRLSASDWGYGFNVGATVQPTTSTRIGLHYRSAITYHLVGSAISTGAAAAANGGVTADLRVPQSASLSLFQAVGSSVEVLGDVTYTGWDSVQQLTVVRTSSTPVPGQTAGTILTTLPFGWDNTWRYSVGANYRVNQAIKLRFGLAYDQTPTKDATRTPRLPDQNRTWLAFGVQYKPTKQGTLEVAYAHEFVKDAQVNVTAPGQTTCAAGCLNGTFKNKADIISLQYSHAF
jgi:long-chain fatty acid transport protein